MVKDKVTFEEIFEQNERRIHYYTHRLKICESQQQLYQDGLFTTWNAYKTYQPDNGLLATYFNYIIRNSMNDSLSNQTRKQENGITYLSGADSNQMKVAEKSSAFD